jgi:uncharacterized repeat protein (TIGR01451 family)
LRSSTAPVMIENTTPSRAATTPAPRSAEPRVARSSPRLDNRHNELADALTGLRDSMQSEPEPPADAPVEAVEESEDIIAPPAADGGESAPSYLDNIGNGATDEDAPEGSDAASTAPRGWSSGPLDVRDALLGDAAPSSPAAAASNPPARYATPPAPAAAPTPRPTAPRASAPQAQRSAAPATTPRSSPRPAPAAERDLAADLVGDGEYARPTTEPETDEALGAIEAAPAPIEYEPAPSPAPTPAPVRPRAATPAPAVTAPSTTPPAAASSTRVTTTVPQSRPTTPAVPRNIANIRPRGDVLASCRPPMIISSVAGPQRIIVGRPSEYRVVVENKGDQAARQLVATVAVPGWAAVEDAVASNGEVNRQAPVADGDPQAIKWELYELGAGEAHTLTLKLVPSSGRPLLLAVQCDQAPATAEATVDVQEPKLQMEITGPEEVMFGKSQRYTLLLSNPGTGDAEDVVIELVPPGGDVKAPVRHKVGALAAGSTKTIELELTAREAGELKMQAAAMAAGDLRSEMVKTVLCRRAKLDVDWRGPDKSFAGAVATYYLRVRNPGTAPAERVAVEFTLPAGAELVDASAGHSWDGDRRMVSWQPGALNASEERFMQVRCKLNKAGANELTLVARTEAGDLSDVQAVPVNVEALADLKLQVTDPQGVLPVGQTATYEIRVQNRGQTAARGVNVAAMFSAGIDPVHVEGGQHEISDGRVAFRPIDMLPAGAEVVLRIHAKAADAGTHVFRAEVVCDDLDTKLAAEETTRYFVEEERWADASAAYSDGEATTR